MALQWLTNNKATTRCEFNGWRPLQLPCNRSGSPPPPPSPLSHSMPIPWHYKQRCSAVANFYTQFCLHFIFAKFLSLVIHVRWQEQERGEGWERERRERGTESEKERCGGAEWESSKLCAWLICVQCEVINLFPDTPPISPDCRPFTAFAVYFDSLKCVFVYECACVCVCALVYSPVLLLPSPEMANCKFAHSKPSEL